MLAPRRDVTQHIDIVELAEYIAPGVIGGRLLKRVASAGEDIDAPGTCLADEIRDEPGLAHARVALDDKRSALVLGDNLAEGRVNLVALFDTSDHLDPGATRAGGCRHPQYRAKDWDEL